MSRAGRQPTTWRGAVALTAGAHPGLAAFTLAYLTAFTSVGVKVHSDLVVPYVAVVTGLVVLVVRIDQRHRLGADVLWALSAWGLVHMAGGVVPLSGGRILYNAWLLPHRLRYDQAVHAFGFGSATVACGRVLGHWLPLDPPGSARGPAVVAGLAGLGIGALNEVVEFLSTLVLATTHVGGFENTGWDLVFNLLGATGASLWLASSWPARTLASDEPGAAAGARGAEVAPATPVT